MKARKTERGFVCVGHRSYPNREEDLRLIQESSAINFDYDDALDRPGSSYLWVGDSHHLNREEVRELISRMQHWLDTGRLAVDEETP